MDDRDLIETLNMLSEAKLKLNASIRILEEFLDEERGAPSAEEEIRADFACIGECPRFPETDPS